MEQNKEKQFFLIYYKLILEKNEQLFIRDINIFSKDAKMHNIKSIKDLITKLKQNNLLLSYKILTFLYTKSYLFDKITKYEKKIYKMSQLETVITIHKKFKNDLPFINSFKLFPTSLKPLNDESKDQKIILKTNDDYWFDSSKIEILDRLEQIVKRFGIILFHKLGINVVSYNIITTFSYKQLCKYYNKLVIKLRIYILKTIDICDDYINIEKSYVITLINHDTFIDFDNSDIEIEETTDNIVDLELDNDDEYIE